MQNLLNLISIVLLVLYFNISSIAQAVSFDISIAMASNYLDNIQELDDGWSETYFNSKKLPNMKIGMSYRNFLIRFEHFSYDDHIGIPSSPEGVLNSIRIRSYSLLFGYEIEFNDYFRLNMGSGVTFTRPGLGLYIDWFPQPWEAWLCTEDNSWGTNFWINLETTIYQGLFLSVGTRFNPMFSPFNEGSCGTPHTHDRLNYLVTQLSIGYRFGKR